jgi:glycosyltransferase involved in cell wall biosynthesis
MPVRRPRLDWLREAVASILAQTLTDLELLVVVDDDASLEGFLATFNDGRIRHLHLPQHPGLPAALNHGLAQARAPLIARLDADDVAEPSRLERQLEMFDRDPSLDVAGSQILVIDEDGTRIGYRKYPLTSELIAEAMQRYNCLAHPAVMFRRLRVMNAGGYAAVPMEDYDLWCRLVVLGARFGTHPEALVRYRYHRGITRKNVGHTIRATIDIKRRHFGSTLSPRARARIAIERMLLVVPAPIVAALFRATQFTARKPA